MFTPVKHICMAFVKSKMSALCTVFEKEKSSSTESMVE